VAVLEKYAADPVECTAPFVDAMNMRCSPRQCRRSLLVRGKFLAAERSIEGLAECLELRSQDLFTVPVWICMARGTGPRRWSQQMQLMTASVVFLEGTLFD